MTRRTVGPSLALTLVPALVVAAPSSPAVASDSEARFLDALVELRLGRVLDTVLAEPDRDPVEQAVYRVRLARAEVVAAMGDAGLAPAARRALVDDLMDRSAALIAAFPTHPRAGVWRLDRAEDAWRWLWSLDVAGAQVVLGVPEPDVRQRVEQARVILAEEVRAAAPALEGAIESLEFAPGWPDDPALVREHRRLDEDERRGRLPAMQVIAGAISVAAAPTDVAPEDAAAAEAALVATLARLEDQPASAASRAMHQRLLGHVRVRLGSPEAAASYRAAARAAVAANDPFGGTVSTLGAAAASGDADRLLATVRAEADGPGPLSFLGTFAADLALRGAVDSGRSEGFEGWATLARRDRAWLRTARERFARAAGADPMPDELPVVGRLGWALAIERMQGAEAAVPHLARVTAAGEATSDEQVLAWHDLHRLWTRLGHEEVAARAVLVAAILEPDAGVRGAAFDRAIRAAHAAVAATAGAPGPRGAELARWPDDLPESGDPTALLIEAVERAAVATAVPPIPGLDRWRLVAASRAVAADRPTRAAALLAEVDPDGPDAPTAAAIGLDVVLARLRDGVGPPDDPARRARATARMVADAGVLLDRGAGLLEAGRDPDGLLRARLGDGRRRLMQAEIELMAGDGAAALAALGLDGAAPPDVAGDEGADAGREPFASSDPAVRAEALRLATAAVLAGLPDPDQIAIDAATARRVGTKVVQFCLRSPAGADILIRELDARLARVVDLPLPLDDPERARRATAGLVPIADGLAAWLRTEAAGTGPSARLDEAAAEVRRRQRLLGFRAIGRTLQLAGRSADAVPWLEPLGGTTAADPDVLLAAAEARFALGIASGSSGPDPDGHLAAAMTAYRRLGADREGAGERRWWTAQLRQLQILARLAGRQEAVQARLERLRRSDAGLGGPRFADGFASVVEADAVPDR